MQCEAHVWYETDGGGLHGCLWAKNIGDTKKGYQNWGSVQ